MGRVIEGYSQLRRDYDKYMNRMKIALLGTVVSFLLIGWQSFFFFIMVALIIFSLVCYMAAKDFKSGVNGERRMTVIGNRLPSSYTVVTNVELHHEGKITLLDSVIIGPAGIYVVEVKNMNGTIVGQASSFELVQHKVGRNGGRYSNRVKNPIRAVGSQVHTLSTLLKHHQLGVWVSGIVFFTNREATVKVENATIPVLSIKDKGGKRLKQLLIEAEANNQMLSEQAQQKAISILTGKVS